MQSSAVISFKVFTSSEKNNLHGDAWSVCFLSEEVAVIYSAADMGQSLEMVRINQPHVADCHLRTL